MKKLSRHELMQYGTAIISFLIVMTFTLLIFFWFVQQSVDKSVQNVLQKNTLQQKDHLELVLEKEYEFLEGPAAYFGTTSDLFSNDNLQLLAELASSSSYHRLMLFFSRRYRALQRWKEDRCKFTELFSKDIGRQTRH